MGLIKRYLTLIRKSLFVNAIRRMSEMPCTPWFGAIDQGTTSSRFIVFDSQGQTIASSYRPVTLCSPKPGWLEIDPELLYQSTVDCINDVAVLLTKKFPACRPVEAILAIGIANQRETTVAWDSATGAALCPAIIWMDTRTKQLVDRLEAKREMLQRVSGLPLSTYFSALKMRWMLDSITTVADARRNNRLRFGTKLCTDSPFQTDVTNAHRTMLVNINTGLWDANLRDIFDIPQNNLAEIRPSLYNYGKLTVSLLKGIDIRAVLGDQHAGLIGHGCLTEGSLKNTYGTGSFLLCNTGSIPVINSSNGLLTTFAYQFEGRAPCYATEASVSGVGSAIEWLRIKLGILTCTADLDSIVDDSCSKDVYFIPALTGSLAPFWLPDLRAAFFGLEIDTDQAGLVQAVVESIVFSTRLVWDRLSTKPKELFVDGGLSKSNKLLQIQADVLQIPVYRPKMTEMTAFGAARAAALSIGCYFEDNENEFDAFYPRNNLESKYQRWCRYYETLIQSHQ